MDTPPADGIGDGLLLILLLTVFFAATAADPAVAQVQLPTVNLEDTNFEDGFEASGWFLEEFPGGYTAGELKDSKLRFPRCRNPRNDGPPAGCAGRHAGYLADGCLRVAAAHLFHEHNPNYSMLMDNFQAHTRQAAAK